MAEGRGRRREAWALAGVLLFFALGFWVLERRARPAALLVDVAQARGLDRPLTAGSPEKLFIFENVGSGAGLLDFDADGRLDVVLAGGGRQREGKLLPGPGVALYRQRADGVFEEVGEGLGIAYRGWATGVAVGDIENDGDPDIFLGTLEAPLLFRNEGGTRFTECAREAGLTERGFASSAVFLDYDRDGLLDLYLARYVHFDLADPPNGGRPCIENGVPISCGPPIHRPLPDLLYRNQGGGRFEDVTGRAGMAAQDGSYGLGVAAGDLDGDGWPDLYVANDTTANYLWRNRGDGSFEEIALEAGCALSETGQGQAGMGVDLGDADGDGRPEVFVSNYAEEYNSYYQNLGGGSFADRSSGSGLGEGSFLTLGWGTKFADLDQDGALDLFVANGHVHPRARELKPFLSYEEPILFYRGDGDGRFALAREGLGPDAGRPRAHRGAAVGDLDGDGDLDLLVTVLDAPPVLLANRIPGGRSLVLRLRGVRSNREGIGARVELQAGGRAQHREVTRGGSYLSASDAVAHFGLGPHERAESVRISWPSGQVDTLGPLAAGAAYLVEEGGKVLSRTPHRPGEPR